MCQKNFSTLKLDILRNKRWILNLICNFSTEHVTYQIHPYRVKTMDNCRDSLTKINPCRPVRQKSFRRPVRDTLQNSVQFYPVDVTKEVFHAKIKRLCNTRQNAEDSPIRNFYFCCTCNKPIQFATALLLSYANSICF